MLNGYKTIWWIIAYLDAALKVDPNEFQLYQTKADTYTYMNKIYLAIQCYNKALELNPGAHHMRKARDDKIKIN